MNLELMNMFPFWLVLFPGLNPLLVFLFLLDDLIRLATTQPYHLPSIQLGC